jgi:hypothetical protein
MLSGRVLMMLWYAVVVHLVWGVALLFSADPLLATPVAELTTLVPEPHLLGVFLCLSSLLAAAAMLRPVTPASLVLYVPQQALLMLSSLGAALAIAHGSYADGVERPVLFILADQSPAIIATVCHTAALLRLYGGARWVSTPFRSQP